MLAHGGRCRVCGSVRRFPVGRPDLSLVTLTRLPEPTVLVPSGTALSEASWGDPRSVGSVPQPVSDTANRADSVSSPHPPITRRTQQASVAADLSTTRSDPTPLRAPGYPGTRLAADSSLSRCPERRTTPGWRWSVDLVLPPHRSRSSQLRGTGPKPSSQSRYPCACWDDT